MVAQVPRPVERRHYPPGAWHRRLGNRPRRPGGTCPSRRRGGTAVASLAPIDNPASALARPLSGVMVLRTAEGPYWLFNVG